MLSAQRVASPKAPAASFFSNIFSVFSCKCPCNPPPQDDPNNQDSPKGSPKDVDMGAAKKDKPRPASASDASSESESEPEEVEDLRGPDGRRTSTTLKVLRVVSSAMDDTEDAVSKQNSSPASIASDASSCDADRPSRRSMSNPTEPPMLDSLAANTSVSVKRLLDSGEADQMFERTDKLRGLKLKPAASPAKSANSEESEADDAWLDQRKPSSKSLHGASSVQEMLDKGQADPFFVREGGLKGLRLVPAPSTSPSTDGEDSETEGDWLEPTHDDAEKLKHVFLAQKSVNDFFSRESAIRGLKLISASSDQSSAEESDVDAGDWFDEDTDGDTLDESLETVELSSKELFEAMERKIFQEVSGEWVGLESLKTVLDKSDVSLEQQSRFRAALRESTFNHGEYIVRQGEPGDKFYIITEGEVVVTRNTEDGGEHAVTHLYEGHFFGETSLVKEAPRNANVRVSSDVAHVMHIDKPDFKPFLEEQHGFHAFIDGLVSKKEATMDKRKQVAMSFEGEGSGAGTSRNEVKISVVRRRARTTSFKTIINNYVFLNKVGRGAFGTVYRAQSVTDSKYYAVKHIDRAQLAKKKFSIKGDQETLREITVMKRLQHKNVVRLHEVVDDPSRDCFYMVQEYMEHGPVMEESEINEPIAVDMAKKYFRDVLTGLAYLHFQGVIHRDIKPGNLLLGTEGTCKIADFGTAILTHDGVVPGGDIKGTPAFMAPELFTDDNSDYMGYPVDVWALGVSLYNMVVGIPPFLADNEIKMVEKIQTDPVRIPSKVIVDAHLRNLLLRMMAKDPRERITLVDLMTHPWVTDEGSHPMDVSTVYGHLELEDTEVMYNTMASVPSNGSMSPEPSFRSRAKDAGADIGTLDLSLVGSNTSTPAPSSRRSQLSSCNSGIAFGVNDVTPCRTGDQRRRSSMCAGELMKYKRDVPASTGPVKALRSAVGPAHSPSFYRGVRPPAMPYNSPSLMNRTLSKRVMKQPMSFRMATATPSSETRTNKDRLRALRARQFALTSMHTNLRAVDRDRMLDQQRLPIHSARASVHVEEFFVDKKTGGFVSPKHRMASTTSEKSMQLYTPRSAALSGGPSTPLSGIHALHVDSPADSPATDVCAYDSSNSLCTTPVAEGDMPRKGSLRRLEDFIMINSSVDAAVEDATVQQRVIFRATGDGSLSITGGRGLKNRRFSSDAGTMPVVTEDQVVEGRSDPFPSALEGVETVEDDGSSDDESDLDSDVEVLDDMEGNALESGLGDLLDSLAETTVTAEADPELDDFTKEEGDQFEVLRNSQAFRPAFGNPLGLLVGQAEDIGRRSTMEDRVTVLPDLNASLALPLGFPDNAFFAVFDGHGGQETSSFLADHLHEYVCSQPAFETDPSEALIAGALACDDVIVEYKGEEMGSSGSTGVVVMVRQGSGDTPTTLYCANVGDSRAVLSRGGTVVEMSDDHKPSRADEKARIEEAGGSVVRGRLFGTLGVSRAYGDVAYKTMEKGSSEDSTEDGMNMGSLIAEPELSSEPVHPEDEFVVLACDGVFDVLEPQQVVNYVRRRLLVHHDPGQAAEELVAKAISLNTIDNVSAVVVRLPNTSL